MKICYYILSVLFLTVDISDGLCTYPSDIRGTWQDSVYGDVDFSDSAMFMKTKGFISGTSSTNFTCEESNGDLYISKSVNTVTLNLVNIQVTVNVYICMELKSLTSSVSYYYNLRSGDQGNLNFGDVIPIGLGGTIVQSDICNTTPDPKLFHLLMNPASATTGLSTCPLPLLGDFTYTMSFGNGITQCGSSAYWNGCFNTSVVLLNNTGCGTQFVGFSSSGELGCVYSIQDTTTTSIYYVGMYNFDASVNGASTVRFACFAVQQNTSGMTYLSQSPKQCASDQTPKNVPANGALLQMSTITSCAPVSYSDPLSIGEILAIVFSVMVAIFLTLLIGVCIYRWYIKKNQKKTVIIPKTLPRGAHNVLTMSDTSTMVNKEIITEPKLVVKPIRNGQPQSMELQEWKHNAEFQAPEGQLRMVRKPQHPAEQIDTMKSRVATQMREESERRRNMALVIDRVKTNLDRELRVISALRAKDVAEREALTRDHTMSRLAHEISLAPAKSRMSQYINDPQAKSRMSMRKNKVTNGALPHGHHHNTFNNSFDINPRTSTPVSVRPSSIDMVMSEANLSIFSADLKYRTNKTPKPQPDITVTKKLKDKKKFPTIKELSNMPGEFQNFER